MSCAVLECVGTVHRKTRTSYKNDFLVKCHTCALDPELFGDATWPVSRANHRKGVIPCGCGRTPKWTEKQTRLRVERTCEHKGYTINGWQESWDGIRTRIDLTCQKDGYTWNTCVGDILNKTRRGCSLCKAVKGRMSEEDYIARWESSGNFPNGSFRRLFGETAGKAKLRPFWSYTCSVCADDEYTKAGLCTGEFRARAGTLDVGHQPCRCSKKVWLTKEQMEYRITQDTTVGFKFLHWNEAYRGFETKFTGECDVHGIVETSYEHNNSGTQMVCPECRNRRVGGFRKDLPGHVYVLRTQGTNTFTGYGITNFKQVRLETHHRNLKKVSSEIVDVIVFDLCGEGAEATEREIKKTFPLHSQDIEGFKREATFAHLYEDVVAFVKSLLPQATPALA